MATHRREDQGPLGTEGYASHAATLIPRYDARDPLVVHGAVLHFFPTKPSDVLDIGAGSGRDAGYFASAGHRVLAVEPTAEMREPAMALHPSSRIEWLDDSLPKLDRVISLDRSFDVIFLTAVWMHLDEVQRATAMPRVAQLVRPGGRVFISLRHGPVPKDRRMFEVTGEETAALAAAEGLGTIFHETRGSKDAKNRAAGVRWTRVVLERGAPLAESPSSSG